MTDTSSIQQIVGDAKRIGAVAIRIYTNLSPELVRRIAAEARRQGMRVWAHASVSPASPANVVAGGVHSISHATYAVRVDADTLTPVSRGTLHRASR